MRFRRRCQLVAIAVLAAAGTPLAACGGPDGQERAAAEILRQTFRSDDARIEQGYLSLSVRLEPKGALAARGPLVFTLLGPFSRSRAGTPERFDVELAATLAERQYAATVLSTGERRLLTLDDRTYELDGAARPRGPIPVTGFDPERWITGARVKRHERAVGASTVRIGGEVNVERLLEDLDGYFGAAAGSSASGAGRPSPQLRRRVAGAVRSSWIDIWTGATDRLLRQVSVRFEFSFDDGSPPPQALRAGKVNLHLRLDDVNRRVAAASSFAAPRTVQAGPPPELSGSRAAAALQHLGAAVTGRSAAAFACFGAARGSSASLLRCLARPAP